MRAMAEPGERLVRLRRADSDAKAARVLAALEAMVAAGEPPGVSVLARRAGVSRRFVYDHPELRAELARRAAQVADHHARTVSASARATTASLRADLENAKARNHRLDVELVTLRHRLSELIGREVLGEISATDAPAVTGTSRRARAGTLRRKAGPRAAHRGTRSRPSDQPRAHGTTQPRKLKHCGAHLCATQNPRSDAIKHNSDSRKGHENTATTQVYIHADLALKERAIARTAPRNTTPGRYQPADHILAFLDGL